VRGCITIGHSFDDILDQLKAAWIVLKHDHPFLAVSTSNDRVVYETPDETELKDWMKKTLVVCGGQSDPRAQLKNDGKDPLFPVEQGRATLMIKCSHRYIDGRGMVHLLSNLIRLIANPEQYLSGASGKTCHLRCELLLVFSVPLLKKL
jgi:hypothetical protein